MSDDTVTPPPEGPPEERRSGVAPIFIEAELKRDPAQSGCYLLLGRVALARHDSLQGCDDLGAAGQHGLIEDWHDDGHERPKWVFRALN